MMKYKQDMEKVRERMGAFWERELIDRALISIQVPKVKGTSLEMFNEDINIKDPTYMERFWTDADLIHENNVKRMENTYFAGDALPSLWLNFGTSGHCNYFGSIPTYSASTVWFDPVIEELSELTDDSYDETAVEKQLAIVRKLVDLSKGEYLIGMPDNCGTIDALGHLYGSENVLMDMLTDPEEVKRCIDVLNRGYIKSSDKFNDMLNSFNDGIVHSWMHLIAPSKLGQMQCDMSVMFSREMYEEFAVRELETQIKYLDYPVYHFDGIEQERHLDILLDFDKLKAIQWTNVAGQPPASHFIPVMKRIQAAKKRLIVMVEDWEVPIMLENLSARGLQLVVTDGVKDVEHADALVKYAEQNSKN